MQIITTATSAIIHIAFCFSSLLFCTGSSSLTLIAKVFKKYGIDFCCHGEVTLETACASLKLAPEEVMQALKQQKENGEGRIPFSSWPLDLLMDYILKIHHRGIRKNGPELLALLEKVGLAEKKDEYPCRLSGGQQQRVAIARALMRDPKVMLFDEPTSALDPQLTGEVLAIMQQLAAEHRTMVVVTHEMSFARGAANRILYVNGGLIAEEGTPEEIFGAPKTAELRAFLGSGFED